MDPGARPARLRTAERVALALLSLAALIAWVRYRNLPTYDSLSSMIWGRDIVHLRTPQFAEFQAPTEHPLWVAVSTVLAVLGDLGARGMTAIGVGSLVALAAGTYRLGRDVFGPVAGALGALLLLSRLDFGFYAAFAFVDVPFAAAIVWAAALEVQRPRRGGAVWVLLIVAGLLRPEGWAYAGAYALWLAWGTPRSTWPRLALPVLAAPLGWFVLDLIVTGNPIFSFTYTTDAAAELGRTRAPSEVPDALWGALREVLKAPVVAAGVAGLVLALGRRAPRLGVPVALLVLGIATFAVLVVGGVSAQVPRYAAISAVALILFAAHLVSEALDASRGRPWAMVLLGVAVIGAGVYLAGRLHPQNVDSEFRFRASVERDLRHALRSPAVTRARRCGAIAVPTHKLLPAARWRAPELEDVLVARNDPDAPRRPGAVLIELGPRLVRNSAYGVIGKSFTAAPLLSQVPPAGYDVAARTRYFAVYARC